MQRALAELREPHREVLVLRYYHGMDEGEIAHAAGIARGTVKSRLHYAMRYLRERLAGAKS